MYYVIEGRKQKLWIPDRVYTCQWGRNAVPENWDQGKWDNCGIKKQVERCEQPDRTLKKNGVS